ncbi:hypothetical protein BDR05DRAFT_670607 [Suillus weaverae]|nr:hypothetical protein BDR05DRAFT_670607 [Suillus weaverae]
MQIFCSCCISCRYVSLARDATLQRIQYIGTTCTATSKRHFSVFLFRFLRVNCIEFVLVCRQLQLTISLALFRSTGRCKLLLLGQVHRQVHIFALEMVGLLLDCKFYHLATRVPILLHTASSSNRSINLWGSQLLVVTFTQRQHTKQWAIFLC